MIFRGSKLFFYRDGVEELLSEFRSYSENGADILSFKKNSCKCRVLVPEGTFSERVEDILSDSETNIFLQKAHRAST
jgi:hypothetical protein